MRNGAGRVKGEAEQTELEDYLDLEGSGDSL